MEKYIPVVVIKELSETDTILTALKNNNINCAEITFRTACAEQAIEYACKHYPDMVIGAGTVINGEQCKKALKAGATFIVSPGLSVEVAHICKENNVPYNTVKWGVRNSINSMNRVIPRKFFIQFIKKYRIYHILFRRTCLF